MPIQNAPDSQKVDYLWKKIVYGAAKTDISGNIDATNEPVASPLLLRGDKILQQASLITSVIPGSNSSVVTVYPTTFPVECTSTAGIPTPTLTWQTGQTFWIPPEFGSTYQIKVYIAPSGNAANVASKGTQVFATGSGNNDLWVFDYQSGILNFNSNNTPYNASNQPISFTGNSVYISGAVYSGTFGLGNLSYTGANITSSTDITISTTNNANIILNAGGTGIVQIIGDDAVGIPYGNTAARPANPSIGYVRINTDLDVLEYWNGSAWIYDAPFEITSQSITPNGSSNAYVLTSNTSTTGVMVNINGTIQQPYTAYNIVGNNSIVFTEIPLTTDIIEVRTIATGVVAIQNLAFGDTSVSLDAANVNVTGNILPTANTTYSLGSSSLQWKDLYVSGNSIYMGGTALTISNGVLLVGNATVGSSSSYSNVNVAAYTQTMGFQNYGNVNVAAYVTTNGLTNYSNVNVIAYTQTQSFTNYSNVNVAAYTQTQSYTNYSNVNVAAYVTTNGLTNYSNVNASAYLSGNITVGNITSTGNISTTGYFLGNASLLSGIIPVSAGGTGRNSSGTKGDIQFASNTGGALTSTLLLTYDIDQGFLGIGSGGLTNDKVHALSLDSVAVNFRAQNANSLAKFGIDSTGNLQIYAHTGKGQIFYTNGGVEQMRITSTGNVVIAGNIAGKTNGFTLGYLEMPQVASGNVTLALSDSGKHFYNTTASPQTITIPSFANVAFGNGTVISIANQSTSNISVALQSGVILYLAGNATSASRTITSYGVATLLKVNTNTWFINGSGVA